MNKPPESIYSQLDLNKLKNHLIELISRAIEVNPPPPLEYKKALLQYMEEAYQSTKLQLQGTVKQQLFHEILDELLGLGPLQPLLNDSSITEIMVNGPDKIYIERDGRLSKTDIHLENDAHILRIIDRIILPLGRRIDPDRPTVDARLMDGSRVNAVIPPVAIDGPNITIRKFQKDKLSIEELIELESITKGMADFLRACVIGRLNIVISGGTGSGKTTLLNILSTYIPEAERIVTIEDAAELNLQQEHVVRLETKTANLEGEYAVTTRDLVRNALRMRPDRIVVGEVRGGEALDMLQAMNTGHDGSLTTVHSNSPRDAVSRMETLCLMAGMELPVHVIRQQIAAAVDVIIQVSRMKDGSRKVVSISEVSGMEGDTVVMSDIFKFQQTGIDQDKVIGELKPTGIRPLFSERLQIAGFKLGAEIFAVNLGEIFNSNRRK
jgi:pilus assembly protein CpaF